MSVPRSQEFHFGTKAETLMRLSPLLRSGEVLPLEYFTVKQWREAPERLLARVRGQPWGKRPLIVRSSALSEDRDGESQAGQFDSRLDVNDAAGLRAAVDAVIDSYGVAGPEDQVLVQPLLADAVASGVASSCDPGTEAPYRLVNWSEGSDTTVVTAGRAGVKSWYFLPCQRGHAPSRVLRRLPAVIEELETILGDEASGEGRPFEFEFGIAGDGSVVLFQMRALAATRCSVPSQRHREAVTACQERYRALNAERPPALGAETVLGVMPDWNPAEILGVRPRPLALSLYRELITDSEWAEARLAYGYRDVRGVPLLVDLQGLPYIDVRASFTSLVPAAVDEPTARRLVAHYLAELRTHPEWHDKVEFSIALASYHFNTGAWAHDLVHEGVLTQAQAGSLVAALHDMTRPMLLGEGPYEKDLGLVRKLADHDLRSPASAGSRERVQRLRDLTVLAKRYGGRPFAGLARVAFVATSLLRSVTDRGLWSVQDADHLLRGAGHVTGGLQNDLADRDHRGFLQRYGHLRPGTYDIRSARYDESDAYIDWMRGPGGNPCTEGVPPFELSASQRRELEGALTSHRLPLSPDQLLGFIRGAIGNREYAKLQYSRAVSEILTEARKIGERLGFGVEDLSYTTLDALTSLSGDPGPDRVLLSRSVEAGKQRHEVTQMLLGPALVRDVDEFLSFTALEAEPNFVTRGRVVGPVADVDAGDAVDGRIAMIPSADPGYDWIFTRGLTGLITAYGGANSHMAIRALELGLPAAIGIGESNFQRFLSAGFLELDAAESQLHPVTDAGDPPPPLTGSSERGAPARALSTGGTR
ncbi:phosphoenolpyruvate synthase [Streptomyces arenae]|nr:phosphoenolpyruvate synthase [Streptomyces arenae]